MSEQELTILLKQAMTDVINIKENDEYIQLFDKLNNTSSDDNKEEYEKLDKEVDALYDRLLGDIANKFDEKQKKEIMLSLSDEFYQKNKISKVNTMWDPLEQIIRYFINNINDNEFINSLVSNPEYISFISYNQFLLSTLLCNCNDEQLIRNFFNNVGLVDKNTFDFALENIMTSDKISQLFKEQLINDCFDMIVADFSLLSYISTCEFISKDFRKKLLGNEKAINKLSGYGISKLIASVCETKEELEQIIFSEKYYNTLMFSEIIKTSKITPTEKKELLLDERINNRIDCIQFVDIIIHSDIDINDKIELLLNPIFKKIVLSDYDGYEFGNMVEYCHSSKMLQAILNDNDYFNILVSTKKLSGFFTNRYNPFDGERLSSTLTVEDKLKLLTDSRLINNIDHYFFFCILNDEDIPDDVKKSMMFDDNIFYKVIDEYHEIYNPDCKNKGPFKYDKKEYLKKLFENNPYLYKTINFELFKDDILDIGFDFVEQISKYPALVEDISKLSKKNKTIFFNNMIKQLENSEFASELDIQLFVSKIIDSINGAAIILDADKLIFKSSIMDELMYNLNASELTDDEWKTLVEISLRDRSSYYKGFNKNHRKQRIDIALNIHPDLIESDNDMFLDKSELEKNNKEYLDTYHEKRIEKCNELFKQAVENKNLDMAKNAYFNKYLCINIDEAREIYRMYGHSLDKIDNNLLSYSYINNIRMILEIEKIDTLVDSYNDNIIPFTFDETIYIDQQLKQVFAKDMSDSVFKVIDNNGNIIRKPSSYVTYNYEENGQTLTKQIPVYDSGMDFKMLIHSTAAYGELQLINNNYFDSWNKSERKKNHGICCSLISNNNMGMAAVNDVLFGFDGWDSKAIVKSSPYDLYTANDSFNIEENRPLTYMTAQDIIDNTRHTHNEHVLERAELRKDKINPEFPNIQPSYVIIYSDMKDEIKNKAFKCASEMNIPIVYIDKKKIVENEKNKIDTLITSYHNSQNIKEKINLLEKILLIHENNRSGLKMTNHDWLDKYFPTSKINALFEDIIKIIHNKYDNDNNIVDYYQLSNHLINILEKEKSKFDITMESVQRKNFIDIPTEEYKKSMIEHINSDLFKTITPKMKIIIDDINSQSIDTEFAQLLGKINTNELDKEIRELQNEELYQENGKNHNIGHIERVVVLSKLLGKREMKKTIRFDDHDYKLLIEAAKYHDCGRKSDKIDREHGKKSAEIAKEKLQSKYSADDVSVIQVAIEFHEMEDNDFYFDKLCEKYNITSLAKKEKTRRIANCLKDADALDRARFKNGAKLDSDFLRNEYSKEFITFAEQLVKKYQEFDLNMLRKMAVEKINNEELSSNNLNNNKGEIQL